jgi:hypothetical protein
MVDEDCVALGPTFEHLVLLVTVTVTSGRTSPYLTDSMITTPSQSANIRFRRQPALYLNLICQTTVMTIQPCS